MTAFALEDAQQPGSVSTMSFRAYLISAVLAAGFAPSAHAEVDGDTFTANLWGWNVSVSAPKNWQVSEERSYPNIVLSMIRRTTRLRGNETR